MLRTGRRSGARAANVGIGGGGAAVHIQVEGSIQVRLRRGGSKELDPGGGWIPSLRDCDVGRRCFKHHRVLTGLELRLHLAFGIYWPRCVTLSTQCTQVRVPSPSVICFKLFINTEEKCYERWFAYLAHLIHLSYELLAFVGSYGVVSRRVPSRGTA